MSRVQQLYQLQVLDSEADKIKRELAEIAARLGESVALKTARASLEASEKSLRQAQAHVQDLDLEVKSLTGKIAQQEKTLYGGGARNPKEAANLQQEVASLKRRLENREEALLEAMVAAEEGQKKREQASLELAGVQADWEGSQQELVQAQSQLKMRMAQLVEQRPTIANSIPKEALERYEALRPQKAGRAVAMMKDGVCQGCGMVASNSKVQRARMGTELITCSTCGRIMYVP